MSFRAVRRGRDAFTVNQIGHPYTCTMSYAFARLSRELHFG